MYLPPVVLMLRCLAFSHPPSFPPNPLNPIAPPLKVRGIRCFSLSRLLIPSCVLLQEVRRITRTRQAPTHAGLHPWPAPFRSLLLLHACMLLAMGLLGFLGWTLTLACSSLSARCLASGCLRAAINLWCQDSSARSRSKVFSQGQGREGGSSSTASKHLCTWAASNRMLAASSCSRMCWSYLLLTQLLHALMRPSRTAAPHAPLALCSRTCLDRFRADYPTFCPKCL